MIIFNDEFWMGIQTLGAVVSQSRKLRPARRAPILD